MDYDRIILEMMNRISVLEEKVSELEGNKTTDSETGKGSKKYRRLTDYLLDKEAEGESIIRLSFDEIEKILGFALPESKKHRAFWANTESHPIALAWLCTSYRTVEFDDDSGIVVWEKRRR